MVLSSSNVFDESSSALDSSILSLAKDRRCLGRDCLLAGWAIAFTKKDGDTAKKKIKLEGWEIAPTKKDGDTAKKKIKKARQSLGIIHFVFFTYFFPIILLLMIFSWTLCLEERTNSSSSSLIQT
jgi:hypothetical protein